MKRFALASLLVLVAAAPQSAVADSDLGCKRLGGALAYVSPEDIDGTVGFGAFMDMGTIAPRLGLEMRCDYWSKSEEAFDTEVSIRDITLGARGKFFFPMTNATVRPFLGTGLGMHFLNAEVTFDDGSGGTMTEDDSQTELGVDLGGGMHIPLGTSTNLHTELWYTMCDIDQFAMRVGLSFPL